MNFIINRRENALTPFNAATFTDTTYQRRYDVDWLRVLAMVLLIIYHIVVSFQPWATKIFFIQNEQSLEGLWIIMAVINVWRIPILFLISGMGVRFAMERRDWKQLLKDRTVRILIPFLFGFFFICPISAYFSLRFYNQEVVYIPNPGHLWFLTNIFLYVLLLLPFWVYMRNNPDNYILRVLSKIFRRPLGLYFFALPVMVEVLLVNPTHFPTYAMTPHGFYLGMICFIVGFVFISIGDNFWRAVESIRRIALIVAFLLYLVRLMVFHLNGEPNLLTAFESVSWMLAILGYGSLYLNRPSDSLTYFSKAVYPVYIIHMPVQYCISYYLLPLALPVFLKLVLLLLGTFGASLLIYEYFLRRLRWIQPMFGIKIGA